MPRDLFCRLTTIKCYKSLYIYRYLQNSFIKQYQIFSPNNIKEKSIVGGVTLNHLSWASLLGGKSRISFPMWMLLCITILVKVVSMMFIRERES